MQNRTDPHICGYSAAAYSTIQTGAPRTWLLPEDMTKNNFILRRFVLFAGVGAIGTTAHYLTLVTMVQLFATNAVTASSSGFVIGATVNYIVNYHYTFASNKRHQETATKFFLVAGAGFLLNGLLMHWMITEPGLHYLLAQIIATIIVVFWTFIGNQIWTFR